MKKTFNDLYSKYKLYFSSKDSLYKKIIRGFYKSAEHINNEWYVDEEEFVQLLPIDENGNRLKLLSECMQQISVSRTTVINDIQSGKIKSAKKIGSSYYVSSAELKELYSLQGLTEKYMRAVDYARLHNIYPDTYRNLCRNGKIPSARQVGKTWYVLKDAPLPESYADLPDGYISVAEYADKHNVTLITLQKSLQQGLYKSAIRHKQNWYINENEPCINLQRTDEVIEDSYISSIEAAKLFNVDKSTIHKRCQKGFYESAKKINNRWYIDKKELKKKAKKIKK